MERKLATNFVDVIIFWCLKKASIVNTDRFFTPK